MSRLEELNSHIEKVVETATNRVATDLESKLEQRIAAIPVHSSANTTSEWLNYRVGEGRAFSEAVAAMYRAFQKEGSTRNAASYHSDPVFVERFLGQGAQGGGNLIPEILAQDVIPALYKRLALVNAGVTIMPMTNQKLPIGRQNARSIASHVGEGLEIPENGPTFNQLELDAKKITARANVSNDFLRSNPVVGLQFVANDLMKALAQAMDAQALEGTGSATAPAGIFSQIAAGNKFLFSANAGKVNDPTGTGLQAKLDEAELAVLAGNVDPNTLAVMLGDRDFLALRRLRSSGILVFEELREARPTLVGKPVVRTNQIVDTRNDSAHATGGDESRIYIGDWSSVLLGIMTNMELAFSTENRFTFDEVVVRLTGHYDVKLRRDTDLAVLSTDWSSASTPV